MQTVFRPFVRPGLEFPLHYVCGMGRHPRGTEPNGRRQVASYLRTHVAPPPIPIFPSARAPHSASLRSKRSGIPVIQECKPSFVLSSARGWRFRCTMFAEWGDTLAEQNLMGGGKSHHTFAHTWRRRPFLFSHPHAHPIPQVCAANEAESP